VKLIRELLEARFEVKNPLPVIEEVLKEGDYWCEMTSTSNLIVYKNADENDDEMDPCVELTFEEINGTLNVRLHHPDGRVLDEKDFKPHFQSPSSRGYFEEDEIANTVDQLFRDVAYHVEKSPLNLSKLHDDPTVQDALRERMKKNLGLGKYRRK
jgi:hypothetical protein